MTPEELKAALHLLALAVRDLREKDESRSDGIPLGVSFIDIKLHDLIEATKTE